MTNFNINNSNMKNNLKCDVYLLNMSINDVYTSINKIDNIHNINNIYDIDNIYPELRKTEIKKVNSKKVLREKYYSWKVLELGIRNSFGYTFKEIEFFKDDNGKWSSNKCKFSISHSKDIVAVAISNEDVGIDIEWINKFKEKFSSLDEFEKFKLNICNQYDNKSIINNDIIDLVRLWTTKESIFKLNSNKGFIPKDIICDRNSRSFKLFNSEYLLTISTNTINTNIENINYNMYIIDNINNKDKINIETFDDVIIVD